MSSSPQRATTQVEVLAALDAAGRIDYSDLLDRLEEPCGVSLVLKGLEADGSVLLIDRFGKRWNPPYGDEEWNRGPLYIETVPTPTSSEEQGE